MAGAVEIRELERVVPHGHARVAWFVRRGDAWVAASQWPGACTERLDSGPGTVWETRTLLSAPLGARLMRVETRPLPQRAGDALDYLTRSPLATRRSTHRTYYRVGARGALERER